MPTPPTLIELLRDPVWRKMFTTAPALASSQRLPSAMPWSVYVVTEAPERPAGVRWRVVRCPTYPDAYQRVRRLLSAPVPDQLDLCVTSRGVEYAPPPGFDWRRRWPLVDLEWCARCRRPSSFRPTHGRHALIGSPVVRPGVRRCYFCGIAVDGMFRYYAPVPLPVPTKKKVSA